MLDCPSRRLRAGLGFTKGAFLWSLELLLQGPTKRGVNLHHPTPSSHGKSLQVRHDIERGRAQLLPEECKDSSERATTEATGASSCAVAAHEAPAEDLDALSWPSRLRSLPELQTPPTADTALACLLERLGAMMQPLQLFCRTAQLRETTGLSKAAVLGTCGETENAWNILQHELALGRQASAMQTGCGQRMSRAQNWTNRQAEGPRQ